jgi:putative lipoprotein
LPTSRRAVRFAAPLFCAAIALCAAAPTDLPTGQWRAESIRGVPTAARSTLDITGAGEVSGSGACNRFHGTAKISGQTIEFGVLAATRMMCAPTQSDQETAFFAALDATRRWAAGTRPRTLSLLDAANHELVRFVRAE